MPTPKPLQGLVERLRGRTRPVFSAYLNANPGDPENQGNAHRIRLKNALRDLEVPEAIAKPVQESVEGTAPGARTLVFFADGEELFEAHELQVDVPEAFHYGEPLLAPMALALESYVPYAAVLVDAEEVRLFVTEPAETPREATEGEAPHRPGFREVDLAPTTPGPRAKTEDESQSHRSSEHVREFYNLAAERLRHATASWGARSLVLAGPHERARELYEQLPQPLQERVVAEAPVSAKAPDGELLEALDRAKEEADRRRKEAWIPEARERGRGGVAEVLEALNEGRAHRVLACWELDAEAGWCDRDGVAIPQGPASRCRYCDGEARRRPLREVLVELAAERGAQILFLRREERMAPTAQQEIRGEAGGPDTAWTTLRDEFEGVAALLRF